MDHDRDTVTEDDPTPRGPHDVGQSEQRGGEEMGGDEPGRHDTGDQGQTGRPTGEASMRSATSIDPQEPIDEDSPTLPPA